MLEINVDEDEDEDDDDDDDDDIGCEDTINYHFSAYHSTLWP